MLRALQNTPRVRKLLNNEENALFTFVQFIDVLCGGGPKKRSQLDLDLVTDLGAHPTISYSSRLFGQSVQVIVYRLSGTERVKQKTAGYVTSCPAT
jgi:hypothetical protein